MFFIIPLSPSNAAGQSLMILLLATNISLTVDNGINLETQLYICWSKHGQAYSIIIFLVTVMYTLRRVSVGVFCSCLCSSVCLMIGWWLIQYIACWPWTRIFIKFRTSNAFIIRQHTIYWNNPSNTIPLRTNSYNIGTSYNNIL